MTLLYILAALVLCFGIYALFAFVFALPSKSNTSAIKDVFSDDEKKLELTDLLDKIAYGIAQYIKIPQSWLKNLSKTLIGAHIDMPADVYVIRALIQAPMIILMCFICSLFFKPIIYAAYITPFVLVYAEINKADKLLKKYRDSINSELPDFVSTLANELRHNHDIVRIMSAYLETAGPALGHELRITISDMKTSDHISALQRLADRVNTKNMNDICRSLIGIQRGNFEADYFKTLYNSLKAEETQRMKEAAQSNVPKLSFCMFIQLAGILALYLGVMLADMVNTSAALF